jgi:general secretion pathway protein J
VRGDARGFTLAELLIALAIVGALLATAFAGLRVGLAAWTQGEARVDVHQHLRGVATLLARSVGGAYPYRASAGLAPQPVVLFTGTAQRLEFVTQSEPLPAAVPIAFTAVVLAVETDQGGAGLTVRQRVLPNHDPFTAATVVLRDPTIKTLELRYLGEAGGWQDTWDGENENALPRAVRISVARTENGRTESLPPLTVSLRIVTPSTGQ